MRLKYLILFLFVSQICFSQDVIDWWSGCGPTTITRSAVNINPTNAQASGTVTTDNTVNDVRVEWGVSSGVYTDSNTRGSGGSGTYNILMSPLIPNTTYYYKVFSEEAAPCPEGESTEDNFTTDAEPRYAQAGSIGTTTGTTLSVGYTSTVNVNDILVMLVATKQSTTITTPSGWTLAGTASNASITIGWYYKTATGSESGSQSVTIGASGNTAGVMYRYEGSTGVIGTRSTTVFASTNGVSTNSDAATGVLGASFAVAGINETISASGGGFTQDSSLSTSSAGGFSFCAASRTGDGTLSGTVTFSWTTSSTAGLYTFLDLDN
jgi:hypothetical protein